MSQEEIRTLTGLRGVAAVAVMVDHLAKLEFDASFPLDMLPHMYLAVDMFMVLSGFILAMTYGERLGIVPSAAGWRVFLLRRIARLYPLYLLTTLVCFLLCRAGLLSFLDPDTSGPALLANLLAVQTWAWPGSSLNGPGWAVSTEWFANGVFPLLLPLLLGRSAGLAALVCGVAMAGLVASALAFGQLFLVPSPGAVNIISGPEALGRCVTEFAIGMYCWRLRSRSRWVEVLALDRVQVPLVVAMFVLMQWTETDTLFVAACAVLILGLSFERSTVSAVLRSAPVCFLGRISYSIYLVHITLLPLRDALAERLAGMGPVQAWWSAVLCCAVLAIGLATLTRRFVETPGQRLVLSLASGGVRTAG